MIIFNLDGVLSDCEHRRHFVDPTKSVDHILQGYDGQGKMIEEAGVYCNIIDGKRFKPDWKSFYEACDKDEPIQPVLSAFIHLTQGEPFNHDVQIWSGRCESVREKTLNWLVNLTGYCEDNQYWDRRLKMRPIGNNEPECDLKNRWLHEYINSNEYVKQIFLKKGKCPMEMVFESQPDCIHMFRRHGIFVFDCRQNS